MRQRLSVFPGTVLLRRADAATLHLCQQLAAVADAEDRYTQSKHTRIGPRRSGPIDAVRAAGEDDAAGVKTADFLQRHVKRPNLAVDMLFPHTSRDQLFILPSKIQNQNLLHTLTPPEKPESARQTGDADESDDS